jgi:hypothetical protein
MFLCLQFILFAQDYTITPIEIVDQSSCYAPVFFNDDLIVCSNQKDNIFLTVFDESGNYPINLYILNPTENPAKLTNFSKKINTKYNDGPIAFNQTYDYCIVSKNTSNSLNKDKKNKLILQEYEFIDNDWQLIGSFPYNSKDYSCTHPALSQDGNTLIFSSNMPGGYGGYDLWKSEKINEIWSKPKNLGSNINSTNNEFFPTFLNGDLYFSSNQGEFGGLDIYKAFLESNQPAIVLKKPINSSFDDFSIIGNSIYDNGYFSSNRNGKDAIFHFEFDFPEFTNCQESRINNYCYTLYEESATLIPNQQALIYLWTVNNEKFQGEEIRYCFPGPGDYEIILDVKDTILDITYYDQSHLNITLEEEHRPYIQCEDTIKTNEILYLDASDTYLPYLKDKKYFWLIDNHKLIGEQVEYQLTEGGIYTVKLGVVGFEDTIKVTECVYKTIVCNDEQFFNELDSSFNALKNQWGTSYLIIEPNHQFEEMFTLNSVKNINNSSLNEKEKKELKLLAYFLKEHPTVELNIYYSKTNDNKMKTKSLNIIKFLISEGVDSEKIKLKQQQTNILKFNFTLNENN